MPCLSPDQVNESFIANTPLIQSTIRNMTIQSPNWYRDVYTPMPWPEGEGNTMQQITFKGELPAIQEGFDDWGLVDDPSGCGPICAPNCSYNMSVLGGHAMDAKITRLMTKDFRTNDYCVKSIQNTRQYKEIFSGIVQNLYNQINFQKEVNVGQNFMTMIAKKGVVDSGGFKFNTDDPYSYRPAGTATLSALNIGMLEFLYEIMRRQVDAMPFTYMNNMPTYALVASPQLISRMYRDDPSLRTDVRAATAGGQMGMDLITKYNFTSTIRDMFLPVSYLWPRRFRYDAGNSRWIRVLPFVKGMPGIVGTYSTINPQYEDPSYATHEEVIIHGMNPFSVWYQPTVETIGEGTDFGPEPGFWDVFQWVNPQTREDPARREGFFFTTATIGLSADNSESVYGILVPRPPAASMVSFYASNACPPEAVTCTNVVPAVSCPVPIVLSLTAHPITAGRYYVTFAAPVNAIVNDVIQIGVTGGGFVNATVNAVNGTSTSFEVTIAGTVPDCDRFVSVFVSPGALSCKSTVLSYVRNAADATRIDLILDLPSKADTAADAVTLFYGNGTTQSATVISANMLTNKWVVDIGASNFDDSVGGILFMCVPTATDATCPACTTATTTSVQCS